MILKSLTMTKNVKELLQNFKQIQGGPFEDN